MAGRTAKIKITLASGAFTGEIKKTEAQVKASGKRMGRSVGKELDTGFKRGTNAMKSMGKSMGRMIKQIGTIGAAFATGALLKDSVEIHKKIQDISFLLSKVPGQSMSWVEIQDMVTSSSDRTTQAATEMADAFSLVYQATGDLKYSKDILDFIGKSATASGKPVEQLAQVADMVRRKWGLTGKAAEDAMSKFIEKADKGGLSLDSLSSRVDYVAGEAALAGLSVTELLGTIEVLDNTMGEMAPRGIKSLLMYMKEGTVQAKRLEKAGRFKFDPNMDMLERLKMIIKNPKAHKEALEVFTETSRTAFDELRQPFVETLEASRKAGDSEAVAQSKALAAYDEMVSQIRKTEMTADSIEKIYNKRTREDPSVKLRSAINKIRDAFAQPKMIDSINKLADKLPALAKVVADIVGFIVDNPLGAAGVGMGLRVGIPSMIGTFGGGMGGGGATGAGKASKGLSGVATASNKLAGKGGALSKFGTSLGGLTMSMAGAAAVGYSLGKMLESHLEKEAEKLDVYEKLRMEAENISTGGPGGTAPQTLEEHDAAVAKLEKLKDKTRKEFKRPRSFTEDVMAGFQLMSTENLDPKTLSKNIKKVSGEDQATQTMLKIDSQLKKHYDVIGTAMEEAYKSSANLKELGNAAKGASEALSGTKKSGGGGGGSRGPKAGLSTDPGAEPKKKKG